MEVVKHGAKANLIDFDTLFIMVSNGSRFGMANGIDSG